MMAPQTQADREALVSDEIRRLTNAQLAEAVTYTFGSSSRRSHHIVWEAERRLRLLSEIGPQPGG